MSEVEKKARKPRKPLTEEQRKIMLANLAKGRAARHGKSTEETQIKTKAVPTPEETNPPVPDESTDEEIVKVKPVKPKKKTKKIVVEESSSDEEIVYVKKTVPKPKLLRSQQPVQPQSTPPPPPPQPPVRKEPPKPSPQQIAEMRAKKIFEYRYKSMFGEV